MKYSLVREVKEPNRAHQTDAGIDFYVPVFDEKFKQDIKSKNELNYGGLYFDGDSDNEYICIAPGYRILIPSGVHVNVPHGYALIAFNKSGIASKKGLITGACITGDTLVVTDHGQFPAYLLTKQFITENDVKIVSYNEKSKECEYKNFSGFVQTGIRQTIRLKFENGVTLECSEDHLIFTKNKGWIEAQQLDYNDDLEYIQQ